MGKGRKRRNRNEKGLNKSKLEFVASLCKNCNICCFKKADLQGKKATDIYCYDFAYVKNPQLFISVIYPILLKLEYSWPINLSNQDEEIKLFKYVFCRNIKCNTDYEECGNIAYCLVELKKFAIEIEKPTFSIDSLIKYKPASKNNTSNLNINYSYAQSTIKAEPFFFTNISKDELGAYNNEIKNIEQDKDLGFSGFVKRKPFTKVKNT